MQRKQTQEIDPVKLCVNYWAWPLGAPDPNQPNKDFKNCLQTNQAMVQMAEGAEKTPVKKQSLPCIAPFCSLIVAVRRSTQVLQFRTLYARRVLELFQCNKSQNERVT